MWKNRDLSADDCPKMACASTLPEIILYGRYKPDFDYWRLVLFSGLWSLGCYDFTVWVCFLVL